MADFTSPQRSHLTNDTVMRIEVSLSSRRSSVIVFNTTARLYSLDDKEWKSMAYGAPCILLLKETPDPDSPFVVKLVIAELESGINLWEEVITSGTEYTEQRPTFHTFRSATSNQTLAVQFADAEEAKSLLASLKQFYSQKQQIDRLLEKKKTPVSGSKTSNKAKKPLKKRLSKFDISQPCNFMHISGLTSQRTDVCEQEIRGTIQRRLRSQSMSSLEKQKTKSRPQLPAEFTDGSLYMNDSSSSHFDLRQAASPRRTTAPPNMEQSRVVVRSKYHSMRLNKKKPLGQFAQSVDDLALHQPALQSGESAAPKQFRYSMTADPGEGYIPQSWMDRPSSPSSPLQTGGYYPGGPTTPPPAEYSNIPAGYRYPSHQLLCTSPPPEITTFPDRDHLYINASPEQAPAPNTVPTQLHNGRPTVQGTTNPMVPQQHHREPIATANPMVPQQRHREPIATANPMVPQQRHREPIPTANPMVPQQYHREPIPTANPMVPQQRHREPIATANPMVPQQHHREPIATANPMVPQQHTSTQKETDKSPEVPLATHPTVRHLLSNPVQSHKHRSHARAHRKPSWVDNYTPVSMSPEHQASTTSAKIGQPSTNRSHTSSSAGQHPRPVRQSSQTHIQPDFKSPQPMGQYSRGTTHQYASSPPATTSSNQPNHNHYPPPQQVPRPVSSQSTTGQTVSQSPTAIDSKQLPANRPVPIQVPPASPSSPSPMSPPPPPLESPSAAAPYDPEMDLLTDELSRLLREFDYLITSPSRDNSGKPTTLV